MNHTKFNKCWPCDPSRCVIENCMWWVGAHAKIEPDKEIESISTVRGRQNQRARKKFKPKELTYCWKCLNPGKTHVHHKDKNILNNNKSNLLPLCTDCHGDFHPKKKHFLTRNDEQYNPKSDN